jgi:flavin-dependent dehydrogenase
MNTPPEIAEHLVIGGGPAGSMAALRLAESGHSAVLLEREPGAHHKVCGEFLSHEAVGYLHQAGVDPLALGAVVIRNLRLSSGRGVAETLLPFQALSLSRRILDEALLARAEKAGCRVIRGISVQSLKPQCDQWLVSLNNGVTMHAKTVFLATGKHDLRGFARTPTRQSDLIGFKLHWRLARPKIESVRGFMELFLFKGGYGGLALIEEEIANLCLVVRRSAFGELSAWPRLLAQILNENSRLRFLLENAKPQWPRPLAISPIPYGYIAQESPGPWRLGDQAAVIPSFTGDGISIALHSGAFAAQMYMAGKSTAEYQRLLHEQLRRSMALATWLSRSAVTAAGRACAFPALRLLPRAMQWIAASTRIPKNAMVCQTQQMLLERDR